MKATRLPPELKGLHDRFSILDEAISVGGQVFEIIRPRNADDLITEADYVMDERLPYWADIWPSSVILAKWLLEHPGSESTIELGCGSGVVTAAAMQSGRSVLATDYYEDALLFARANALRNVGFEPQTRMVDWSHFPENLGTFDLVLASDVLYENRYPALVANAIARSLAPGGTAIVADPGRIAAPMLPSECQERNLRIVETTTIEYSLNAITQQINLHYIGWAP